MTNPASVELAKVLGRRLIERRDAKAKQTSNGAYMPVRIDPKNTDSDLLPWKGSDIVDHIEERASYGHYLVDLDGKTRTFAFDLDLRAKANPTRDEEPIMFDGEEIDPREVWKGPNGPARLYLAQRLFAYAQALGEKIDRLLAVPVLISYSGSKGMHVYALLDPGTPADEAREVGRMVIDSFEGAIVPERGNAFFRNISPGYEAIGMELFPKQDSVGNGGFGNLMRLPLGVNLKTGKKSFFLRWAPSTLQMRADDPMEALTHGTIR